MKLNFTQSGRPAGTAPAVILLHGLFGSLSNLGAVAKALGEDFTSYQLDLRNHGRSPHDPEMSYAVMADDIIEFMDDHKLKQAHLLGHSLGGKIAMQVALSHAERVSKLIVADIAPVNYPKRRNPALEGLKVLAETRIESRQQADDLLAQHVDEQQVRGFLLKNLYRQESGLYSLRLNLSAITANYLSMSETLNDEPFNGPTLFLKGSHSSYIQEKHKTAILSLFPNARIKVISGTGHWLHSEKPDTFNRLVKQFLIN